MFEIDTRHTKMRLVGLDYETYYNTADKYGLRQLTTEQYVRDKRFEVICLTATIDGFFVYKAWGDAQVRALLEQLNVSDKDTVTVAHNGRFDHFITEQHFKIHVAVKACTLLMMRVLGLSTMIGESLDALTKHLIEKGYANIPPKGHEVQNMNGVRLSDMTDIQRERYGVYCEDDTKATYWAAKYMMPFIPWDEMRGMDMAMAMYTRPAIVLNKPLLVTYLANMREERRNALDRLAREYGFGTIENMLKALRSKPKLAALLESLGVEPPMKLSEKKTATLRKTDPNAEAVYDYAFSKSDLEFIALTEHPNEDVAALVQARIDFNSSIKESRTIRFIDAADRGPMVFAVQHAKAQTNRYGADDKLNQQNLPKRGNDKTLRTSMCAPEGFEIGGADSGQIEARVLAYAAGEERLLNIFRERGDPYSVMAGDIYTRDPGEIKKGAKQHGEIDKAIEPEMAELAYQFYIMRQVGKQTILGSGYGMSGGKFGLFLKQNGITLHPPKAAVQIWLRSLSKDMLDPANRPKLKIAHEQFIEEYHDLEAQRINKVYRQQHPAIVRFWRECEKVLRDLVGGGSGFFGGPDGRLFFYTAKHNVMGKIAPAIRLPDGTWLVYPKLRSFLDEESGWTKFDYLQREGRALFPKYIYGALLTENLIQALAFSILRWQAVNIHQWINIKGNVHDEWFSIYRKELRPTVEKLFMTCMSTSPPWCPNLPLAAEFKAGSNYGEL